MMPLLLLHPVPRWVIGAQWQQKLEMMHLLHICCFEQGGAVTCRPLPLSPVATFEPTCASQAGNKKSARRGVPLSIALEELVQHYTAEASKELCQICGADQSHDTRQPRPKLFEMLIVLMGPFGLHCFDCKLQFEILLLGPPELLLLDA